jgi:hypothetical protein
MHRAAVAAFAPGHEDAGQNHGDDEQQQAGRKAGELAEQADRGRLELGLILLRHAGEVGGSPLPQGVDAVADHRPAGDRRVRRRDVHAAAPDHADGLLHGAGDRGAEQVDWHQQEGDEKQNDEGCGAAVLAPEHRLQLEMQRIHGDRQDHRP